MTVPTSRCTWFADIAGNVMAAPRGARTDGAAIGVLAGLTGTLGDAALTRWLGEFRSGEVTPGVFGRGQAGFAAGLAVAAGVVPRLAVLADRTRRGVVGWGRTLSADTASLRWPDYDLIAGPSGALLALTVAARGSAEELEPFAAHLSRLAAEPGLPGLRLRGYADDPLRGWNDDTVNLGLGHGVPGVVAALAAASRVLGGHPGVTAALHNCVTLLVKTAGTDERGMPVWPACDPAGTVGRCRQAWCYGAPGVAWALWEAGEVLDDDAARECALTTMAALEGRWDPDRELFGELTDLLGVCHGAAGVLAVADAFATHARHDPSRLLRDRVAGWLRARASDVARLAEDDMTLLGGAPGVLAVLSTVSGGRRDWLPLLGLR